MMATLAFNELMDIYQIFRINNFFFIYIIPKKNYTFISRVIKKRLKHIRRVFKI